ncbi:MAG: hypothetical protein EOO20_14225, partial [Chryseobacterium sp.]
MKNSNKYIILLVLIMVNSLSYGQYKNRTRQKTVLNDRQFWLAEMDKMVRPVIYNLAKDSLRMAMPKVTS